MRPITSSTTKTPASSPATGHLHASGGANSEEIHASHGHVNVQTQVGAFYDVTGSVGLKPATGPRLIYANGNPFLFSGREVRKTGPENYIILGGTVTSCRLPRPDWLLSAGAFTMDNDKVRGHNSIFHLLNLPVLYLPYVTQPVSAEGRQSGFLIPVIGQSSTKGTVLGEQIYLAINRSTDLTLGAEYFSLRGWLDQFTFRNRGLGNNFIQAHFSQLFDRGYTPAGGTYTNQGGEDFVVSARRDLSPETRLAADVEYLSSYIYREAFTENFNQAVSTDILSDAYAVTTRKGYTASLEADRYQGLKRVAVAATDTRTGHPVTGDPSLPRSRARPQLNRSRLWSPRPDLELRRAGSRSQARAARLRHRRCHRAARSSPHPGLWLLGRWLASASLARRP